MNRATPSEPRAGCRSGSGMEAPGAARVGLFLWGVVAVATCLTVIAHPRTEEAEVSRTLAVTVDDLPGLPRTAPLPRLQEINDRMLNALQEASVPAIGFVNEEHLQVDGERDARVAILRRWVERGMALGNHSFAHRDLTTTPPAEYEDDVLRGEVVTRSVLDAAGHDLAFFRHPFTRTGPTLAVKERFERFLEIHGYRVAPFSIENSDYIFAAIDHHAIENRDDALRDRIRQAYLDHQEHMVAWAESRARDLFGREIPQILLIHVNALNADALAPMLARLRARRYRFVSLEEALEDPAWKTPDRYVGRNGPSWLQRFTIALGVPMRMEEEPDPPRWVLEAYRALP